MKRSLQLNPDHQPATTRQIRDIRDAHEVAPVSTLLGAFDCDALADKRLSEQLDMFDYLETKNPDGTLSWKNANDQWVPLTKVQLQDLYQEIRINRAIRAGYLHRQAAMFEAMDPRPTVAQLKDIQFWLENVHAP